MDDNRRKTRSSGRRKASAKVADGQDNASRPEGAEAKSKSGGSSPGRSSPARNSPEPDCAICLGRLQNKSFTDRCFHMFCFVCLQEWSKVKAECPLCKQKFTSIIHNVRSNEDYDQYPIPPKIPSWEEQARNFRYHTTLTLERRLQINIPDFRHHPHYQEHDYTLQRPTHHTHMTTRSLWRRQRQSATSDFRKRIYTNNLRVVEVTDPRLRTRDITPEFFRTNPACTHRLVPWLNRELNALLHNQLDHVQFVLELVIGLIKNYPINSDELYQRIYPYVGRYTRHFMHEFETFARSPYNMSAYDQHAVYQPQTLDVDSNSETDSILSVGDDDDDVIVVSPSQEVGGRQNPSPPHQQPETGSLTYRDLSPLLHRVRSFLEDPEGSHLSVNAAGWDSPTPGPSWAAEPEVSDSSLAALFAEGASSMNDGSRMTQASHGSVKAEKERHIDVENSGSDSSSNDSDSDSSDVGSDIVFVGYDRPWQERSPILLSSTDDEEVLPQSTSNSTGTIDKKPTVMADKKPQGDRHRSKHSSESSRSYWRSSRRHRSRSSSRHKSHRRKSPSRARSGHISSHYRYRSRSRERSESRRKRTSSPPPHDRLVSSRKRSKFSLLSFVREKRRRSRSSSVEITEVKRRRSKHKRKEKKHHRKHKSKKHKKHRRVSESEELPEEENKNSVKPRSCVTVVNKDSSNNWQNKDTSDQHDDITGESMQHDSASPQESVVVPTSGVSNTKPLYDTNSTDTTLPNTIESTVLNSSESTITKLSELKSIEPSDSKPASKDTENSTSSSETTVTVKKPYKKHPTGHKKSSLNKTTTQSASSSHSSVNSKTSNTESTGDHAELSCSSELSPFHNSLCGLKCQTTVKTGEIASNCVQPVGSSELGVESSGDVPISDVTIDAALKALTQTSGTSDHVLDKTETGSTGEQDSVKHTLDTSGKSDNTADELNQSPSRDPEVESPADQEKSVEQCDTNMSVSSEENTACDGQSGCIVSESRAKEMDASPVADCTESEKCHTQGRDACALASRGVSNISGETTEQAGASGSGCPPASYMFDSRGASLPRVRRQSSTIEILDSNSSDNESDIDVEDNILDLEGKSDTRRNTSRQRSCVIVAPPPNVAVGYQSDVDNSRFSTGRSDQDELSSSSILSDTSNLFSNTNRRQGSPCMYSNPGMMYSSSVGTNLAMPSFNSMFHSSSSSTLRSDSFVSNMAVSISTAGVQSQHTTNHVYRTGAGGQWESHHSAHSISRANMGNVEVVQTMSGVAHNNLYGSTRSATSSTMAYIPHTSSNQPYIPPASTVQSYASHSADPSYRPQTNMELSYLPPTSIAQNCTPHTSTEPFPLVSPCSTSFPYSSPQTRSLPAIEGGSTTSSDYTSKPGNPWWSRSARINVEDSSDENTDVDVVLMSDDDDVNIRVSEGEMHFSDINVTDISDEEIVVDGDNGGDIFFVSDDSDTENVDSIDMISADATLARFREIRNMLPPDTGSDPEVDSVHESTGALSDDDTEEEVDDGIRFREIQDMLPAMGSGSTAVLEAEPSLRTSVCVSDGEDSSNDIMDVGYGQGNNYTADVDDSTTEGAGESLDSWSDLSNVTDTGNTVELDQQNSISDVSENEENVQSCEKDIDVDDCAMKTNNDDMDNDENKDCYKGELCETIPGNDETGMCGNYGDGCQSGDEVGDCRVSDNEEMTSENHIGDGEVHEAYTSPDGQLNDDQQGKRASGESRLNGSDEPDLCTLPNKQPTSDERDTCSPPDNGFSGVGEDVYSE